MMNRRQALKTLALSAAALPALPALGWTQAATAPAAKPAEAPPAGPYTLPPLGYPFDALEPYLDAKTMEIHHDRHHAAYVANLNKAVAGHADLAKKPVEDLLRDLDDVPEAIRTAVRNQGGGHANHTLFWTLLKKDAPPPAGDLAAAIDGTFGGFAGFQEKFAQAAMGVFGSGWAWLTLGDGKLAIETTPNQDSPLSKKRAPLLGIDVWEHAYYLKYQNKRADYVAAFAKVIDWGAVAARYRAAKG